MAFTVDLTEDFEAGAVGSYDGNFHGPQLLMWRKVDFTITANQLIQNATMGLFDVPAHVQITKVVGYVETADTDVTDVDVGGFSTAGAAETADGFIDGASLAATGYLEDDDEAYGLVGGKAETAEWSIGLTNNDADTINGAVVWFLVFGIDMRGLPHAN